jgi:3-hydroxy-9,10-secoandrosta-1,3,5(10)-triene-9,17-dione monooxygenase
MSVDTVAPALEATSDAEVLQRLHDLLPTLRERAAGAERDRRLPDETVRDLKAAGLARILQPKRYGGLEGDPAVFYDCVMTVASACGSTGWVCGVVGVHPWQIALFDDRVQQEVWGTDPDTWVSSSYMPGGRLTPAPDGFRLNGRWSFSSGSDHCEWAILGVMLDRGEGKGPEMWNVLIPRSDYRIEDTWHTMGLRGTGSNDVVVEDLFVPSYRAINLIDMFSWRSPGLAVSTGPLYRLSFGTMFSTAITAAIIGMAEGVLAEFVETTRARVSKSWGKASEDPHTLSALGRAASEIDACRMQLLGNVEAMHTTVQRGDHITLEDRSRARRDQVQGTARAVAAIDDLFDRSGAGVISDAHPMQRLWRDAHAGRHHTANSVDRSLQSYALQTLGQSPIDVLL